MHEQTVLSSRLNSYIVSQSFLIAAYATSMNNWGPPNGHLYRMAFPIVLSILGFLLSLRAQPGIKDACLIIHRWHEQQDAILAAHPELDDYQVLRRNAEERKRVRDQWFAQTAAFIIAPAWVIFAGISVYAGLMH